MRHRVNVSLPDELHQLVTQVAKGRGVSASRVLLNALEAERMHLIHESEKYLKKKGAKK